MFKAIFYPPLRPVESEWKKGENEHFWAIWFWLYILAGGYKYLTRFKKIRNFNKTLQNLNNEQMVIRGLYPFLVISIKLLNSMTGSKHLWLQHFTPFFIVQRVLTLNITQQCSWQNDGQSQSPVFTPPQFIPYFISGYSILWTSEILIMVQWWWECSDECEGYKDKACSNEVSNEVSNE